ncbi:MAG: ATP synthase F1 subunit epsilon [Rickettsiales bacterium]
MNTEAFHLRIISPMKVVVDAHVPSAQIPGSEGEFGVLPGHANFFSMLRPGVIVVKMSDGIRRRFFAATGYADVTPISCTVISDHIQDLADISMAEVDEAIHAAKTALAEAETAEERAQAMQLLESSETLARALKESNH